MLITRRSWVRSPLGPPNDDGDNFTHHRYFFSFSVLHEFVVNGAIPTIWLNFLFPIFQGLLLLFWIFLFLQLFSPGRKESWSVNLKAKTNLSFVWCISFYRKVIDANRFSFCSISFLKFDNRLLYLRLDLFVYRRPQMNNSLLLFCNLNIFVCLTQEGPRRGSYSLVGRASC